MLADANLSYTVRGVKQPRIVKVLFSFTREEHFRDVIIAGPQVLTFTMLE